MKKSLVLILAGFGFGLTSHGSFDASFLREDLSLETSPRFNQTIASTASDGVARAQKAIRKFSSYLNLVKSCAKTLRSFTETLDVGDDGVDEFREQFEVVLSKIDTIREKLEAGISHLRFITSASKEDIQELFEDASLLDVVQWLSEELTTLLHWGKANRDRLGENVYKTASKILKASIKIVYTLQAALLVREVIEASTGVDLSCGGCCNIM